MRTTGATAVTCSSLPMGWEGPPAGNAPALSQSARWKRFSSMRSGGFFRWTERRTPTLNEFKEALRSADASVCGAAANDPSLHGMGTTLTFAYSVDSVLFVAHVGDSRCYLLRAGMFHQLTRDDTVVQELVEKGVVRPSAVPGHSLRHMVTNIVGGKVPGVRTEVHRLNVEPGDILLLCTDGLTNMVPDDRIRSVLERAPTPEQACNELIRLANEAGGVDNVTAIVARYA
jgi:serine/threonine protein phosphatase PrpC